MKYQLVPMLTVGECRECLDAETSATVSDDAVANVRDDLYALSRIVLSSRKENENEKIWKMEN